MRFGWQMYGKQGYDTCFFLDFNNLVYSSLNTPKSWNLEALLFLIYGLILKQIRVSDTGTSQYEHTCSTFYEMYLSVQSKKK